MKLSVSSLRSPEMAQAQDKAAANSEDSKKIEQEFEQYQEKLKQQKAEWEKEHPDQVNTKLLRYIYIILYIQAEIQKFLQYHCNNVKTLGKIG